MKPFSRPSAGAVLAALLVLSAASAAQAAPKLPGDTLKSVSVIPHKKEFQVPQDTPDEQSVTLKQEYIQVLPDSLGKPDPQEYTPLSDTLDEKPAS
ncbi:hypothetical protein GCM10010446_63690 [Streptomyces enissocaesilis]|uniref:Uncharacterized protein n=1 Tax=Streptomyces enissocaesilis TaxID=332589 RepID=A0ABN3XMK0_9ACTN